MTRRAIRAVLVVALATAIPAGARAQLLPVSVGIGGGPTFSSAGRGTGYHVLGAVNVGAPLIPVGFRLDGMITQFNKTTLDTRLLTLDANLVYALARAPLLTPYLIGGVGYYNTKLTKLVSRTDSDIGINGGAGIKFSLLVVGAFAEVRYHNVFGKNVSGSSESQHFAPVTFGIRF